mgnify:CR=1 FL=1
MKNLHHDVKYSRALSPAVAVTNNTAFVSEILDTANFKSNEVVILTGSLADADATFTALLEEGDIAALSDNAAVADGDLLGTEALASFTFAADNTVKKLGYIGAKRYIRLTVTPANNTGDVYIAAVWAQSGARVAPQS